MHTIHAVALAVSIMAAVPAYAAGSYGPFCLGEADATVKVQTFLRGHDGATLQILDSEEAAAWAQSYNTLLPTSDYPIDKVWIIADPKANAAELRIAFFSANQTCMNVLMPVDIFKSIVEHARGLRN